MFTYPRKNTEISVFLLRTPPVFGGFNSAAEHFCSWISEWVFKKFLKVSHRKKIPVIHRGNQVALQI